MQSSSWIAVHRFLSFSGESLTGRYSRNTEQRLHTSFSSGEFARLKPKDMSSPLASDHSDTGRRLISPIRRRSVDDVSFIRFSDVPSLNNTFSRTLLPAFES